MKFFGKFRDSEGKFAVKLNWKKKVGVGAFGLGVVIVLTHIYVEPLIDKANAETERFLNALSGEVVAYADTTKYIEVEKGVPPIMQRIADCESGDKTKGSGRQFLPNGNIVKNVNTNGTIDAGKWQINLSSEHVTAIAKLGYDVFTEKGNQDYAMHLYENEGTGPWAASASCWKR